jgi:hypothetical protein
MHIERTFSLTKKHPCGYGWLQGPARKWEEALLGLQVYCSTAGQDGDKNAPKAPATLTSPWATVLIFLLSRWSFTHSLTHSLMFNSSRFGLQNSTLWYSSPVRDFSMFETWLLTLLASYNPPGEPCYCLHLFLWVLLPLLLLFLSILAFSMTIVASFNSL